MMVVGEVIETATTQFLAEARELEGAPPFGSLVKVPRGEGEPTVYGAVFEIRTESADASRRPVAFGLSPEELRRQQPQIFQLLRTYFRVLILGYGEGGSFRAFLPPRPPAIHAFVYPCTPEEGRLVTGGVGYIHSMLNGGLGIGDQLAAAVIRQGAAFHPNPGAYLRRAGRELRRLLAQDYERLRTLLRYLS